MTEAPTKARVEPPTSPSRFRADDFLGQVWDCAWSSLWLAFVVQIAGSIALGMASGIWEQMVPSLPPGWTAPTGVKIGHWRFVERHEFALIYGLLFLGKVAAALVQHLQHPRHRTVAAWLLRATRKLGHDWFALTVGNALGAFIAVLVWQYVQRFSLNGFLGQMLLGLLRPVLHGQYGLTGTGDAAQAVTDLVAWYHANQFKFVFWLFYSAGICDDLGLPNYKAMARWFWWRMRKRMGLGSSVQSTS
jgi:hypothetical protein